MTSQPRPFTFDTIFDGDRVIAPARPRRVFTEADLEQARAEGFAAGQASAAAQAEAEAADALNRLAADTRAALSALTALAHEHRTGSAELALACGRAIADAALARFPEAPLAAALDALAREVEGRPRLALRVDAALAERLGAVLTRMAEDIGFAGQVVVKPDALPHPAAFAFDWGEGRAAFDPAAAAARVAAALAEALAAEGLHAEPPIRLEPAP